MPARCPVCQSELPFVPWKGDSPSDEICPHCGIQFGYNDHLLELRPFVYARWREAWIEHGRRAINGPEWRDVSRRVAEVAATDATKTG